MSQPPRYGPAGWEHWPDHPLHSMQFVRTLGVAQQGAATVSECLLAASRIDPADAASWHREWARLAQANRARADAAERRGQAATARANLLRAAAYWRASELFLPPLDALRHESFQRGVECSRDWLRLSSPAGEALAITAADGSVVDAYLLLPAGCREPVPAVVCFGGLDAHKDEMLPRVAPQAGERGIAVLLVDLPGQGETLRLRGTPNRAEMEVPVAACVDALVRRPEVDAQRIGLYGASLGGVYAARAAAKETAAARRGFRQLHLRPAGPPAAAPGGRRRQRLGGPAVGVRLRHARAGHRQGRSAAHGTLRGRHRLAPGSSCRANTTSLGLQTARDAFDFARAAGVAAEFKVFCGEETGAAHCQADNPTLGQEPGLGLAAGEALRPRAGCVTPPRRTR